MRWLDGITEAMNMNGGKHREMVKEGQGGLVNLVFKGKTLTSVAHAQWHQSLEHTLPCLM